MPTSPQLQPYDDFNRELESNVSPPDWVNPEPNGRYNLVVIGGGTAGLVSAMGAAGLGAKVALIERELLGGDCLNVGCVPSKAMLSVGRFLHSMKRAQSLGVDIKEQATADFPAVMARLRQLRASISPHDSADRFRKAGIDVFLGHGKFTGTNEVQVGETRLQFAKAVITSGAKAAKLNVPGCDKTHVLTNETVFHSPNYRGDWSSSERSIGCELARVFATLGSQVTQLERSGQILPREEPDASPSSENRWKVTVRPFSPTPSGSYPHGRSEGGDNPRQPR